MESVKTISEATELMKERLEHRGFDSGEGQRETA
jgi:hypothetical protein